MQTDAGGVFRWNGALLRAHNKCRDLAGLFLAFGFGWLALPIDMRKVTRKSIFATGVAVLYLNQSDIQLSVLMASELQVPCDLDHSNDLWRNQVIRHNGFTPYQNAVAFARNSFGFPGGWVRPFPVLDRFDVEFDVSI